MRYNDKIKYFYNDETYSGSFEEDGLDIGTGLVGAPACGDVMKVQIKVEDNKIIDARVLVFGCGSAQASSRYTVGLLIGKTLEEALQIKDIQIAKDLGLPKNKYHCSVLSEETIKRAIEDYRKKNSIKDTDINSNSKDILEDTDFKLSISEDAISYIEEILNKSKKECQGLRLTLEESNCGLMYKIKYVDKDHNPQNDIIYKLNDKINFFIDRGLKDIINNTNMSYRETETTRGIVFINPSEVGKCGCGLNFKLSNTITESNTECANNQNKD